MEQILGKKIGMTQIFSQAGDCVPVTVIQVERCIPVERKTRDKQGYDAVVVAYGDRKPKHTSKPLKGYYDKLKIAPAKMLREFRGQEVADEGLGQQLKVDMFGEGDRVNVIGASKGRGFAGVMKRWGFHGKPATRGTHESFRGGGSVGMHTYPGRVLKGKKMPGRMGGNVNHIKNLQVVRVDVENNLLLLKGAVPGANGGIVKIVKSKSKAK